jgi:hypothetical protein
LDCEKHFLKVTYPATTLERLLAIEALRKDADISDL